VGEGEEGPLGVERLFTMEKEAPVTFAERTFLNPEWLFSVVVMGLVVGLAVLYASRWFDTAVARVRHRVSSAAAHGCTVAVSIVTARRMAVSARIVTMS
jgi:hypothetical protein